MNKKSKIKNFNFQNLLFIPFIASAVFLSSPAMGASESANRSIHRDARNRVHQLFEPNESPLFKHPHGNHRSVVGTVTSVSGDVIVVASKANVSYTIDTGNATVMKAATDPDANPSIINIDDIKVGDSIMVRGIIDDTAIELA